MDSNYQKFYSIGLYIINFIASDCTNYFPIYQVSDKIFIQQNSFIKKASKELT